MRIVKNLKRKPYEKTVAETYCWSVRQHTAKLQRALVFVIDEDYEIQIDSEIEFERLKRLINSFDPKILAKKS